MKRRLRAPSPALVISIIALFVALGGTSYAAYSLPSNSVGTSQLKNGAVTSKKVDKHLIVFGAKAAIVAAVAINAKHADTARLANSAGFASSLGGFAANQLGRVDYASGSLMLGSDLGVLANVSVTAPKNGYVYVHAVVGTTNASPTAQAIKAWIVDGQTSQQSSVFYGGITSDGAVPGCPQSVCYVGSVSASNVFRVTQGSNTFQIIGQVDGGTAPGTAVATGIYMPFDQNGVAP